MGWNVEDKSEVSAEEKISKKRVDYGFRIRGIPQFFVEVKSFKEGVNQLDSIKQAINYAWHKGCTWAVLTDFSEIVILNAEWKDLDVFHNRFITLTYEDYIKDFETLWLLSKNGFEQDLLDKKAEKVGKKDKKSPIDKQLVSDFTQFRKLLLNDISLQNPDKHLSDDELDESVQRILDRLIFIRTCEDRELEEKQLIVKTRDWKIKRKGLFIKEIRDLFSYFDQEYNSKLFSKHLCDQLVIGYDPLIEIIEGLYNTKDHYISYDFSAIEADALGNIYEQYLGHILNKTDDGVQLKKNGVHRKKQGIYYTGTFIVDFIVRNSLGVLLKENSIQKEDIKILDPACGSGSFLIKAYDIMYEKYRQVEKYSRDSQTGLDLHFGTDSPFTTKVKIIKENIFGVDLDKQAVEISQLNLLLKITEKGHRLPILQENILCGNSLIEDETIALDKAFQWRDKFSEILKDGGFHVIIGNPPYIFARSQKFTDEEKEYFYKTYPLSQYQLNTYLLFIERSTNLLKNNGYFGFIIPNTWQTIDSCLKFREFLFNNMSDVKIVNIPKKIFPDANVDTSILIFKKTDTPNKKITLYEFRGDKFEQIFDGHSSILGKNFVVKFTLRSIESIHTTKNIIQKIESSSIELQGIATVKSGLKAYEVGKGNPTQTVEMKDQRIYHTCNKIDKTYLKYLNGEDVKRYQLKWGGWYLKYGECLAAQRKIKQFNSERILVRQIPSKPPYCINAVFSNEVYLNDINSMNIYDFKECSPFFILGLLNSKLISFWFIDKFAKLQRGLFPQFKVKELKQFPIIKNPLASDVENITSIVKNNLKLNHRLNELKDKITDEREYIERELKNNDEKLDHFIYNMYNLNDSEVAEVERILH